MKNKFLCTVPIRSDRVSWCCNESGIITLKLRHRGVIPFIARVLFSVPRDSRIHLDCLGSAVWIMLDGKKNISEIGQELCKRFGTDAEPVYERLGQYITILSKNKIIRLLNKT